MNKPIYLYVVPFFPSSESWRGGFFFDAVKALVRDGRYDVRVMSGEKGLDYKIDGISVCRFGTCKLGSSDYLECVTDWFKIWMFARKIFQMNICLSEIAVCHVHLLERYAFFAAWMKRKVPSCFTMVHHHWTGLVPIGGPIPAFLPLFKIVQYLRLKSSFEAVDAHIFCSEMTKNAYGNVYPFGLTGISGELRLTFPLGQVLPPLRCPTPYVAYNGVDKNVFCHSDSLIPRHKEFIIGCVANFNVYKSQITLLKAFCLAKSAMPLARMVFVGSGKMLEECKKFVQDNELCSVVEFVSEMNHSALPGFYRNLDLYVLPSYYWEAFNCSLIEAWACGVPCMATEAISFKEVLPQEEWGKWLFPAKDENALAERLLWAYKTRPQRQKLTVDLNINKITTQFLDWIDSQRDALNR